MTSSARLPTRNPFISVRMINRTAASLAPSMPAWAGRGGNVGMSQAAKAQEPTMEEILASIRRIIADDDVSK